RDARQARHGQGDHEAGDGAISAARHSLSAQNGVRDPGIAMVSRAVGRCRTRPCYLVDAGAVGLVRHGGNRTYRRGAPDGPPRPWAFDLAIFHARKISGEAVWHLMILTPSPSGRGREAWSGVSRALRAGWGLSASRYPAKPHPNPSPEGEDY